MPRNVWTMLKTKSSWASASTTTTGIDAAVSGRTGDGQHREPARGAVEALPDPDGADMRCPRRTSATRATCPCGRCRAACRAGRAGKRRCAPKMTMPMLSSAMWWKWPTIQSVLCTKASHAMVALTTPDRPASSQPTRPRNERGAARGPGPARLVDREQQAVERQRRDDRQGEGERLHAGVDRGLDQSVRVVHVEVVRPDGDVGDDGDRPADGDDVARHQRALARSAGPAGSRSRRPGRAAGRRPGGRTTTARSWPAADRPRRRVNDSKIISTSSTASGTVAMIMSIAITVSGMTG